MAYDYQIRPALTQSGYNDADIAYDPNRKAVTLKGKDFLSGDKLMNVSGSNFTDRSSFDTALKGYQQQEQADQTAVQNKQRIDALTNQVANPQMAANPYTSQLDQQIRSLMDMAKTQQNVDPYSTPQYAAYQAQSGRRASEGIRAAQESLGSSGFGRSTALGERAQGVQNQETQYLETQIIPQLIAAEEARRQQQFGNLQSLLNPVQGQQSFFANQAQTERGNARDALSMLLGEDQRGIDNTRNSQLDVQNQKNTEFNQGIAAAGQTGYYNPSGADMDQINQEIAANSAAYNDASPEERQRLHARNVELNSLLGKTDTTGNGDYVGGNPNGNIGQRTVAGQQLDFNQGMQNKQFDRGNFESDRSYELAKSGQEWNQLMQKDTFDLNKAQTIWDNNFKDKSFQQSMNEAAASRGLQWANLDQRDREFVADQAYKEKSFTADQAQRAIDNKYRDSKSGTSPELAKELDGLYTGITSGQLTKADALSEIEDRKGAGLLSQADADQMTILINKVSSNIPVTREELTRTQIDSLGGNNPQDLNTAQLDKLWESDPSGKAAGRPRYDWASWYADPKGRVGGVPFETWKVDYGPKLR